jgi:hypothetical protein
MLMFDVITSKLNYHEVLKRLGTVAGAIIMMAGAAIPAGFLGAEVKAEPIEATLPGRFGGVFPNLPPFAPPTKAVQAALMKLGKPGGLLDAKDDLAARPVELIVNPELSLSNPNHPLHTAGTTFMGQFLDHDMTFDTTSRLGKPTRPSTAPNARTLAFDLDTVYGDGPDDLRGGARAPRRFIGWQTFFDFGDGALRPNKKIHTKISTPLFRLPPLSLAPANYSAHRFLSDTYGRLPPHQIARVSELLQAQLLQPINVNPIQPQLNETNLNIITGAGPARAAFNEYGYSSETGLS